MLCPWVSLRCTACTQSALHTHCCTKLLLLLLLCPSLLLLQLQLLRLQPLSLAFPKGTAHAAAATPPSLLALGFVLRLLAGGRKLAKLVSHHVLRHLHARHALAAVVDKKHAAQEVWEDDRGTAVGLDDCRGSGALEARPAGWKGGWQQWGQGQQLRMVLCKGWLLRVKLGTPGAVPACRIYGGCAKQLLGVC